MLGPLSALFLLPSPPPPACPAAPELGRVFMLTVPGDRARWTEFRSLLAAYGIGGINIRADHLSDLRSIPEVRARVEAFVAALNPRPLVAIDQEGGEAQALGPRQGFTPLPRPKEIGGWSPQAPGLAFAVGQTMGRELRAAGIDWSFAPVADVDTASNPAIAGRGRAFGSDPALVARAVAETTRGLESEGVRATLKHFPGHGGIKEDSHREPARLDRDWSELGPVELPPFREGITAGASSVMVGHIQIRGESEPATLSRRMIEERLRGELGFRGLVVTDGLWMEGVRAGSSATEVARRALLAGNDFLLEAMSLEDFRAVFSALCRSAETDPALLRRLQEATERIDGALQ